MPISIPHCLSNFTLAPSVIQLILCFNPGLCRSQSVTNSTTLPLTTPRSVNFTFLNWAAAESVKPIRER